MKNLFGSIRPGFSRPHATLRSSRASCVTANVLETSAFGAMVELPNRKRDMANDICDVTQNHSRHASLFRTVFCADDPVFCDYRWSSDFWPARDLPWQLLCASQLSRASVPVAYTGNAIPSFRKAAPPATPKPVGLKSDGPKSDKAKPDTPKPESSKPPQGLQPPNSLPIKIFFGATSLALVLSTYTGLLMSWNYSRRKATVLLTLAAGIVIPVILLIL